MNFEFKIYPKFQFKTYTKFQFKIYTKFQVTIRKVVGMLSANKIQNIVECHKSFWSYDKAERKFGDKLRKKANFSFNYIKVYLYIYLMVIALSGIVPFFIDVESLPVELWIPNDYLFLKIAIYISELVLFVELALNCAWFDGLFFYTCSDLEIQFQMIRNRLKKLKLVQNYKQTISYSKYFKLLKRYFIHHKFLLR